MAWIDRIEDQIMERFGFSGDTRQPLVLTIPGLNNILSIQAMTVILLFR